MKAGTLALVAGCLGCAAAFVGTAFAGSPPSNTGSAAASQSYISWTLFPAPAPAGHGELARGAAEFHQACAICHGAANSPGTISLEAKYQGTRPALLEQRTDLTKEVVLYYIRHGIAMMPPFRKTELSATDANAIAAYLSRPRRQ